MVTVLYYYKQKPHVAAFVFSKEVNVTTDNGGKILLILVIAALIFVIGGSALLILFQLWASS